jgi:hypothetical protein
VYGFTEIKPQLFRFINISFTTAALGVAVKIRELEEQYHIMGALGSSTFVLLIALLNADN